jgi:predicted membrane channel-forming protein YqfA (hemolysin III family)
MMAPSQLARVRLSPRHPCLILGVISGACLAALAVAWLLVANRAPSMGRFTFERDLVAGTLIGVFILLPVFRFLKSPGRIFFSGVVAWSILALTYQVMEIPFQRLDSRLGAFHLFVLGAVVFGLLAVLDWVALLLLAARQRPVTITRR